MKAIFSIVVLIGLVVGSYSYIVPLVMEGIYGGYKAPVPAISTNTNTKADDKMLKGDISASCYRFSDISENQLYSLGKLEEIFVDAVQEITVSRILRN